MRTGAHVCSLKGSWLQLLPKAHSLWMWTMLAPVFILTYTWLFLTEGHLMLNICVDLGQPSSNMGFTISFMPRPSFNKYLFNNNYAPDTSSEQIDTSSYCHRVPFWWVLSSSGVPSKPQHTFVLCFLWSTSTSMRSCYSLPLFLSLHFHY